MKIYNTNITKLAILCLPTFLRKPKIIGFLTILVLPIQQLLNEFNQYRASSKIIINTQVCYLEGLLNDAFDYYLRRIKIGISPLDIDGYLFWKEELNKPILFSAVPVLFQSEGYIASNNKDFDVVLPEGMVLSEKEIDQMKLLINANKLVSKTFRIL